MTEKSKKLRNRTYCVIAWLLLGAVITAAAYYTYQNDFKKLSFSQENNDTYVISEELLTKERYEENNNTFIAILDLEHYTLNYLRVTVDGAGDNSYFSFLGTNSLIDEPVEKIVSFENIKLHNGNNDFAIPTQEFSVAVFTFSDLNNITIDRIEFRERVDKKPLAGGLKTIGVALSAYALLSMFAVFVIFPFIRKKKLANNIETVNTATVATVFWIDPAKVPVLLGNKARAGRITAFFVMLVFSLLLAMQGEDYYRNHCEVYVSTQLALMLLLIASIPDKKCPAVNNTTKDNGLIAVWTALWLYTFISDIMVEKYYRFSWTGIFILIMLLSCLWCTRKDSGRYIRDFGLTVQAFLILLVAAGIIMNPVLDVERYSGPLKNPSIYALYLAGIWAVLLGLLENSIKNKATTRNFIIISIEMFVTAVLLYSSQSLTPLIAVFVVTVIWAFRMIALHTGYKKAFICFAVSCIVGITSLTIMYVWVSNSEIETSSRIIAKFQSGNISSILSMRNHYWSAYLRNMNLFGHTHRPFLWEHRRLPHNALISMAYWYGVPVIVPYILMMVMSIEKAWRFANTKMRYSAVPLYSIAAFVIMSMADNVEQPFVWLPWIACYLMMAPILVRSVDDIEKLKASDITEPIKGELQ